MKINKITAAAAAAALLGVTVPFSGITLPEYSITADAAEYTSVEQDGITYNVYSDHAEVFQAAGAVEGDVVIPDKINDKPVTAILDEAFYGNKKLTGISMPASVASIGKECFAGCSDLKTVTIPEGVKNIPFDAFCECLSLEVVEFPAGLKIVGSGAFYKCVSLKAVSLPEGLEELHDSAFAEASSLTSVVIPASVKYLGEAAFCDCTSLKEVTILSEEIQMLRIPSTICNNYHATVPYTGVIYGPEESAAKEYAEENGYKFALTGGEAPADVPGDLNGDRMVDSTDASLILEYYAYNSTGGTLSAQEYFTKKLAEMN